MTTTHCTHYKTPNWNKSQIWELDLVQSPTGLWRNQHESVCDTKTSLGHSRHHLDVGMCRQSCPETGHLLPLVLLLSLSNSTSFAPVDYSPPPSGSTTCRTVPRPRQLVGMIPWRGTDSTWWPWGMDGPTDLSMGMSCIEKTRIHHRGRYILAA